MGDGRRVDPTRTEPGVRFDSGVRAEKELWVTVMENAILDGDQTSNPHTDTGRRRNRWQANAQWWYLDDERDDREIGSLAWCCVILDLDISAVRRDAKKRWRELGVLYPIGHRLALGALLSATGKPGPKPTTQPTLLATRRPVHRILTTVEIEEQRATQAIARGETLCPGVPDSKRVGCRVVLINPKQPYCYQCGLLAKARAKRVKEIPMRNRDVVGEAQADAEDTVADHLVEMIRLYEVEAAQLEREINELEAKRVRCGRLKQRIAQLLQMQQDE